MTTAEQQLTGAENIRWDLSDLYAAPDDPQIGADMDTSKALAQGFADKYRGQVASFQDPEDLFEAMQEYETLVTMVGKLGSYAFLIWTTDTQNPELGKLLARIQQHYTDINQLTMFFDIEWKNAPDAVSQLANHPTLARYGHHLKSERAWQPFTLSEPEEQVINQMSQVGASAWNRYFGEVMSNLRFPFEGKDLTQAEILALLKKPNRDVRRQAADVITDVLAQTSHTTTFIFNQILLDKQVKDQMRGFDSWVSSRNLSNQVDDDTVEALVEAVTSRYDIVAKHYHTMRDVWGYEQLFDYDRYAPTEEAEQHIEWPQAREIVLESFSKFDGRMADVAAQFFDNRWIDAPIVMGKRGGAYSASTVTTVHPYIFMNYEGNLNSVMTLAHELGHGIHQYLSRQQGEFQADTPLNTAEMASTFCEMLVFDYLTERESDPAVRFAMRADKVADTFATIFRQVSMNRFEHAMHTARREQGELDKDQLSEMWMTTQSAMFGDSLTLRDEYSLWWSYIPHFIGVPGYVYAYAFGELLVWALYARYQNGVAGFADTYVEVLKAGGSDYPHKILEPMGVDLQDPQFWHDGLSLIDDFVIQTQQDAQAL